MWIFCLFKLQVYSSPLDAIRFLSNSELTQWQLIKGCYFYNLRWKFVVNVNKLAHNLCIFIHEQYKPKIILSNKPRGNDDYWSGKLILWLCFSRYWKKEQELRTKNNMKKTEFTTCEYRTKNSNMNMIFMMEQRILSFKNIRTTRNQTLRTCSEMTRSQSFVVFTRTCSYFDSILYFCSVHSALNK